MQSLPYHELSKDLLYLSSNLNYRYNFQLVTKRNTMRILY
ncbi:hypothetical protein VCR1J2_600081 [Vibrio coralliirubri]|nr:hypothetical protein VCR1J2_600081 [Vibrio coralliirubri]